MIKQLLNILKNIKAEEIDCFETLIFLNIEENTHYFVRKMKVCKKDRKQFLRIFSPMSLDTSFCSYNAFHWTRNSYTSANDVADKKLRARSIDRIPE